MESSPYNTSTGRAIMPDLSQWSTEDFGFLQSIYTQQPSELRTETPFMMTESIPQDHSLMHNPYWQDHPRPLHQYTRTDPGIQGVRPNAAPHPPTRDHRGESSVTSPLDLGHNDSLVSPVPSLCIHEANGPKVSPKVRIKNKKPCARHGASRQKQDNGYSGCNWKDCTYPDMFSSKGALMRHIDTQHVAPHSVNCLRCGRVFNRKDNMAEHMGRVHRELL